MVGVFCQPYYSHANTTGIDSPKPLLCDVCSGSTVREFYAL